MAHTRTYLKLQEEMIEHRLAKIGADEGLLFNDKGVFSDTDREAMLWLYGIKFRNDEFEAEIRSDYRKSMDHVARLYLGQKCAFQDVLSKEGFEIASECPKGYDGRIATLSILGSLRIFGKPTRIGRFITMDKIYGPGAKYDQFRGELLKDLKLGAYAHYSKQIENRRWKSHSSQLRGIAINPKGSGEPELEARNFQTICQRIHDQSTFASQRPIEELVRDSAYKPLRVRG